MIRVEARHGAGLGSLFNLLIRRLADVPHHEEVSLFANSPLYAPADVNMVDWYFENRPSVPGATLWTGGQDWRTFPANSRLADDRAMLHLHRASAARFLRRKPELLERAHHVVGDGRVLGLHVRGTDKRDEVPAQPYERVLASYAAQPAHDRVFLATDEAAAVAYFRTRIPDLIVNPHRRSTNGASLHGRSGDRRQADETMLDVSCLALCSTLLVGRGNLGDLACVFSSTHNIQYHEDAGRSAGFDGPPVADRLVLPPF
jgi:hypothetical protein